MPIDRVVCCGGIAGKNDVFLQIYADVIGQPMLVAGSSQAPALGAAISAAVTAGEHPSWTAAQQAMTSVAGSAIRCPIRARMPSTMSSTRSTGSCTTSSAT